MAEYIERPERVDAEKIVSVTWDKSIAQYRHVTADGREGFTPKHEEAAVGDYWVFSPGAPRPRLRENFEREYHKA